MKQHMYIGAHIDVLDAIDTMLSNENSDLFNLLCDSYGYSADPANNLIKRVEVDIIED